MTWHALNLLRNWFHWTLDDILSPARAFYRGNGIDPICKDQRRSDSLVVLTGATLRTRFLSYLESPVATLLSARARSLPLVLFYFTRSLRCRSPTHGVKGDGTNARWASRSSRGSQLSHPYSGASLSVRACMRACVRALALRAKRRLNAARRIGRPRPLRNRGVQRVRRGRERRMGRTGIMEQTARAARAEAKRKPACRGAPRVRIHGPLSADLGAASVSLLENHSQSVGEWITARIDR